MRLTLLISMMLASSLALGQEGGSTPPKVKGSYETETATVLDVKRVDRKGYTFTSIQIEFEKERIWVSGMMPIGDVKIGDTVNLMVSMNEMPSLGDKGPQKVMSFMVMPDFKAAVKDKETPAQPPEKPPLKDF